MLLLLAFIIAEAASSSVVNVALTEGKGQDFEDVMKDKIRPQLALGGVAFVPVKSPSDCDRLKFSPDDRRCEAKSEVTCEQGQEDDYKVSPRLLFRFGI